MGIASHLHLFVMGFHKDLMDITNQFVSKVGEHN